MPSQSIKSDSHHRQDEGVVIFDLAHQYPSVCCPLPVAILTGLTLSPQIGSPPTLEPRAAASSGNVPERPTRTEATSVSQPRCIHAHAWKQTCGQCRGQVRRATTGLWSCATPIDRSSMARPILILSSVLLDQRRPRIPTWSPAAFSHKEAYLFHFETTASSPGHRLRRKVGQVPDAVRATSVGSYLLRFFFSAGSSTRQWYQGRIEQRGPGDESQPRTTASLAWSAPL